jgi:hypothetical protein
VLPNVLVIGAQKCGTTGLYQRFARHPECAVIPGFKEPHFFIDEGPWPIGNWHRGVDWYGSLFPPARIVADVCPSYSGSPIYPGAAARARSVVPAALIVYLVRDPIDRIVSHWMHFRSRGYERRPFAEAVLAPGEGNEYLAASRFGTQLGVWLDQFPRDQVLVLHQEAVAAGREDELWRRLGTGPPPGPSERLNISAELTEPRLLEGLPGPLRRVVPARLRRRPLPRPAVDADLASRLRAELEDDIARFHALCDVRLEGWPGAGPSPPASARS